MTKMFKDDHAIAILLDGKVLPEKDNSVVMQFGSEYKIRLRNKSRNKSIADVFIDGDTAAKGIILDPDSHVDLERFVKDLNVGARFKLARLTDPGVVQPGESQNGLVEVKFYPEKQIQQVITHDIHQHHYCGNYCCPICKPWDKHPQPYPVYPSYPWITYCSTSGGGGTFSSSNTVPISSKSTMESCTDWMPVEHNLGVPEAAATIKGSQSDQKFVSVVIDVDTSQCVTLSIKLMGASGVIKVCPCGRKRKNERYCPQCGKQLIY